MENLWMAGQSVWMKQGKEVVAAPVVVDTGVVEEEEVVDSSEEEEVEEVMAVVTGAMEEETGGMAVVIADMVGTGAMVEEVVATKVEVATLLVGVETTTETGVLAMEIVGAPTEMAMTAMVTGEHCWSEVASTGAVLEVQLAACHVQPHSPRGISALLNVFAFLTLCCNDGPKLLKYSDLCERT
ncbi:cold inducible RNA binding protein a isoform X6 [Colossoma macropomum]|uniref:cold inducible RNA binding protein a isoform X6 n=1 Tax=Colossoma macropomum TaxID=42526 RepID=UPI001863E81B|nr:cold inducible RNA binding protein a isoform X6 [Colossoma macropomum]